MNSALQGTRYGAVLAQSAKDEQARRTQAARPDEHERRLLLRYVRQQVANGGFEALMQRARRANAENNPHRLTVDHFEILDTALVSERFGQGAYQRKAITKLLEAHLIKPVGGGLYSITEAGRRTAQGLGGAR